MIINHQHRFCFFSIPRTASTAISQLLIEKYGSESVLKRHTTFREFMTQASSDEKQYFKFTAIRHPMDSIVSAYFKKKSDHRGRFSRGSFKKGRPLSPQQKKEYQFIVSTNATFPQYFLKFYTKPYHRPNHEETVRNMDSVIRFENLNDNFKKVTDQLNLSFHPIPNVNATSERDTDFLKFYTPEIIPLAKKVFTPIMKDWGYDFPEEWG